METDIVLVELDAARTALAKADTIQKTKKILDVAVAAEIYAKRQQLGEEAVQYATSIKLEALRQLGNMLMETPRNTGVKGQLIGRGIIGSSLEVPPIIPTLLELGLDKKTSKLAQDVAKLSDEQLEKVKTGVSSLSKVLSNSHVSSDEYEWYTPKSYIQSARDVMGSIDLDPASTQEANKIVKAKSIYTQEDDGLSKSWDGNVWLNPPYSMPHIELFIKKVHDEHLSGKVTQAIVLTNNSTDTSWFHLLANSYPFCMTKGRISFWNSLGEVLATRQGQVFFYLGSNNQRFKEEFEKYGIVVGRL